MRSYNCWRHVYRRHLGLFYLVRQKGGNMKMKPEIEDDGEDEFPSPDPDDNDDQQE